MRDRILRRVGLKQPTKPEERGSPTFYHCASLTRPAGPQTQIGNNKVQLTLGDAGYIPYVCGLRATGMEGDGMRWDVMDE